ncbi:MAG: DinB family protein [Phycisphaerales bacterium]|nr:DinB family protein [Phycisphaerales bacterium]
MDRSIIERYASGADAVSESVRGLTDAQAASHPVPGKWSVRQLAVHLLDSDLVASDRMKRIAAEERPLLMGYDENRWLSRLPIDRLNLTEVGEAFALNRRITAALLRGLEDSDFDRVGVHSERGIVTLAGLVTGYIEHLDGHLIHMRAKLERLKAR